MEDRKTRLDQLLGQIVAVLAMEPWLSIQGKLKFIDGKYYIFVTGKNSKACAAFVPEDVKTMQIYGADENTKAAAFIRFDNK